MTCAIDVGANKGQYARMLRDQVGFMGRIASIEPAREPFRILTRVMAGDSNWHGYSFALGQREEDAILHIASADEWNSMHKLNTYAAERFGPTGIGTESVVVRRLDSVFDELVAGHQRVFLKVDTQGNDLAVLEGLGSRAVAIIQAELSLVPVYDATPGFIEVIEKLSSRGYSPAGFFPVSWDQDRLALVEVDGLFVHTGPRP